MILMKKQHLSETINVLQNHRSIRKFKQVEIPREHIHEIVRSGQGAASSQFVQAYSVIVIKNKAKKDLMASLAGNQKQISECPVFLLFCADLKRIEYACKKESIEMDYDWAETLIVGVVDTALVAQNVLVAAESLGYGGCYIGGIRNNPKQVSELAGLPDKVLPLFGLTLGVPNEDPEVKPRLPIELILHEETYREDHYDHGLNKYNETISAYYQSRTTNSKSTNWTKEMANSFSEKRRPHMMGFLKRNL